MNLKKEFKKNKGITLIALVITVIVLLILAGVTIAALSGDNGILNKASEAKEKSSLTQTEELIKLSVNDALAQGLGSVTDANLKTALNSNLGESNYEIEGDADIGWKITSKGQMVKVSPNGKVSLNTSGNTKQYLPEATEVTKPYYPDSEEFEKLDGTNLDTGLVIRETVTGSEYVWVEVPRTSEVYKETGLNVAEFNENVYNSIEEDLRAYSADYRKQESTDTFVEAINEDEYKDDWFSREDEYNKQKQKMLKSVYENGGFWVGRYEAGIRESRTAKGEANVVPVSKINMYPYTFVTRSQAKKLAEKVNSGNSTSSLMFGVQWNLMLKYVETKMQNKVTNIKELLNSDSTTIGNYISSDFTFNRGKFIYFQKWYDFNSQEDTSVVNNGKKVPGKGIIITTGATDEAKLQNIYDFAGNVLEFTFENVKGLYGNGTSACRGNHYYPTCNASDCNIAVKVEDSNSGLGFRVAIY